MTKEKKKSSKSQKGEKKPTLWDIINERVNVVGGTYLEAIAEHAEREKITQAKMAKMLCKRLRAAIEQEVEYGQMVQRGVLERYKKDKEEIK